MPGKTMLGSVKVRATVEAIDKEKSTVTLKGPKGRTLTLDVRDKQKLDAIKVVIQSLPPTWKRSPSR